MSDSGQNKFEKLKKELTDLGLYEPGMDLKDMSDLLAAISNSEDSAREEQLIRETKMDVAQASMEGSESSGCIRRRYIPVLERRLPWCLFPDPTKLSVMQKMRIMAAYKRSQNICRYRRARTSSSFADWDCVINLPIVKHRVTQNNDNKPGMQTRSGRAIKVTPHYIDDGSDSEDSPRKKKRKTLSSEEIIAKSSLFKDITSPKTSYEQILKSSKYKKNPTLSDPNDVVSVDLDGSKQIGRKDSEVSSVIPERSKRTRTVSSSVEEIPSKILVAALVHGENKMKTKPTELLKENCTP